jgi:NADH-quinone oxidoreductase subunit A
VIRRVLTGFQSPLSTEFRVRTHGFQSTGFRLEGERHRVHIYGENWIVIAFMLVLAFFMGNALLTLNRIAAPSKPSAVKAMPYESGVPDVTPVKPRFTPRFYVIAMLFVVFDLEVVFIFPWAVVFDDLGLFGFVDMVIFLGLLLIGYAYAWKKGALEWV